MLFLWHQGKKLQRYYRDKLSEYPNWEYKNTARKGLVFEHNLGPYLSIDETSLSHGELYTVVTNKQARGKKGTLVAIMEGTKSEHHSVIAENIAPETKYCTGNHPGFSG